MKKDVYTLGPHSYDIKYTPIIDGSVPIVDCQVGLY